MRPSQLPPVVKNLLIINGIMFLLKMTFGTDDLGRNILDNTLGLHALDSPLFKPWQVVTHMFMHGDIGHIFLNMFALFMFGGPIERLWGSKRFLIYYLITGLGAAALHQGVAWWEAQQHLAVLSQYGVDLDEVKYAASIVGGDMQGANDVLDGIMRNTGVPEQALVNVFYDQIGVIIGASGAVFGILLAFGMMFPNVQLMLLFPPIPIKAKYFVIGYGLLELYMGLSQRMGDNVAHFAHVGGMLFGWLLIRHWKLRRPLM